MLQTFLTVFLIPIKVRVVINEGSGLLDQV